LKYSSTTTPRVSPQGVEAFAGELRKGHDVIVPDLYEGATLRFLERVD